MININFIQNLKHFFGFISTYKIAEIIPLGMTLHIGISAFITIFLLKKSVKFRNVCLIVFAIGLSKEIIDSFVLNNTWQKHLLDLTYDMSYPCLLYFVRKLKLMAGHGLEK